MGGIWKMWGRCNKMCWNVGRGVGSVWKHGGVCLGYGERCGK